MQLTQWQESGVTKSAIYQVCLLLEKVHFQVLLAMAAQSGPLRFVEGIFKMSKPNGDSSLNDYFCQAFFLQRFVPRVSDC